MTCLVQPSLINVDDTFAFLEEAYKLKSILLSEHQVHIGVGLRSELLGFDEAQLEVLLHDLTNLELIDP